MTSKIRRIRNNILSVSIAQILSLLLNIVTFGIIARVLSVNDFGRFNYLIAIIGFVAKIIDLGINPIVLRETTKTNKFKEYIGPVLLFKILLIVLLLLVINIYSFVIDNSLTEKILLNLFTINIFFSNKFTNIRELLIIPYKVNLRMEFPMLLVLMDSSLLLIFTIFIKPSHDALIYFAVAYVVSNIPSTVILMLTNKNFGIKISNNWETFYFLLKMALPIYGYVILMVIFSQADTVLIGTINGAKTVGFYSTAIRLTAPFLVFASAINVTFFPIIVKKLKKNENITKIVSSILTILILFSSLISLFLFFYAKELISIVFGYKYISAVFPLRVLSISTVFVFVNFFLVDLLTALNRQKWNFKYGVLINFIAIPLYLILLPDYSFKGASLVKLFALLVGTLFLVYKIRLSVKLKVNLFRIIIWVSLNGCFFYVLENQFLYIKITLEIIVILVTILIFRILSYDEIYNILSMINQQKLLEKIKFLVNK